MECSMHLLQIQKHDTLYNKHDLIHYWTFYEQLQKEHLSFISGYLKYCLLYLEWKLEAHRTTQIKREIIEKLSQTED